MQSSTADNLIYVHEENAAQGKGRTQEGDDRCRGHLEESSRVF
jgi:hypothetical protein